MPVLSAKIVKHPQRVQHCEQCGTRLEGEHVKVFGYAERGDPPYNVRQCIPCAKRCADLHPKIRRLFTGPDGDGEGTKSKVRRATPPGGE